MFNLGNEESFKLTGNVFLKAGLCGYMTVGFTIFFFLYIIQRSLHHICITFIVSYASMMYLLDILIKVVNILNTKTLVGSTESRFLKYKLCYMIYSFNF